MKMLNRGMDSTAGSEAGKMEVGFMGAGEGGAGVGGRRCGVMELGK